MKKILYYILLILLILFIILIYSRFIGTIGLKTNEIPITTINIPESFSGLKIVHFADIHYKKIITEDRIKELVSEINKLKPDIVLFTGDLLDNDYNLTNSDINFLIEELSKIESTYGNYSIIGDNDYNKIDTIKNIYIQSNFILLDNNYTIITNQYNDKIFIGGLSTYTYNNANINEVMEYFNDNENINYKIIMIHEPDYIDTIINNYSNINLILSSHSLNGSINIPIIKQLLLPAGATKYYKPYYKINNTDIYISSGIGVNNINFRLFNPPSINFYRIRKSS